MAFCFTAWGSDLANSVGELVQIQTSRRTKHPESSLTLI